MRVRVAKSGGFLVAVASLTALAACTSTAATPSLPSPSASTSPSPSATPTPTPTPAPPPTPQPAPPPVKHSVSTSHTNTSTQQTAPPPQPAGAGPDAGAASVFAMINSERASVGLPRLSWDGSLVAAATRHDQLMAGGCGAHDVGCADGGVMQQEGNYLTAAENVGALRGSAAATMDAVAAGDALNQAMWNEGPGGGHHQNIANAQVTAGCVSVQFINGAWWITEYFHSTP